MTRPREASRPDAGFTLVELLVTLAILPIILGIIGSLVVAATRVNSDVGDRNQASSIAQVIADDIGSATRQAVTIEVIAPTAGTSMLIERTADSSPTATATPSPTATGTTLKMICRAWYLAGGTLWSKRSATAIAAPTNPKAQGWTMLAQGVTAERAGSAVFAANFPSLALSFTIDGDAKAAIISNTITSRAPAAAAGSTSCR